MAGPRIHGCVEQSSCVDTILERLEYYDIGILQNDNLALGLAESPFESPFKESRVCADQPLVQEEGLLFPPDFDGDDSIIQAASPH